MKTFSLKYKLLAFLIVILLTFKSLHSINSHTYTSGVVSYHHVDGCFGSLPVHLSIHCDGFHGFGF